MPAPTFFSSQEPQTENDFLEAADEYEQSGGKWRAGDAAKATRFFNRAIDAYNEGLNRFSSSFDLAYNKAVLQYQLTQDERIAALLGDHVDLLNETLQTHYYALKLDNENADILFNTAQVLTSLAEKLDEGKSGNEELAIRHLREAIELFSSCLRRQELQYEEMQTEKEEAERAVAEAEQDAEGGVSISDEAMETSTEASERSGDWAAVVEPTTPQTLLDTALATLGALMSLTTISAPTESSTLANISEIASPLINSRIPSYISLLSSVAEVSEEPSPPTLSISISATGSATQAEVIKKPQYSPKQEGEKQFALASALFSSAMTGAEFRSRLASSNYYFTRVKGVFQPLIQTSKTSTVTDDDFLIAYGDTLMDIHHALRDAASEAVKSGRGPTPAAMENLATQEEVLREAQQAFSRSKQSVSVLLARGGIEIWLFQLSRLLYPQDHTGWKNLRATKPFYLQAVKGANGTEAMEAKVKSAVADFLIARYADKDYPSAKRQWETLSNVQDPEVKEILKDAVDDGLLVDEDTSF